MEIVIWSKRNAFLNEFSIPASGNRLSVQFTQYSFIQKFFPVCGNRKIQFLENNLFPGNRNRFSGLWKPFFSFSLRHSCHCQLYFPSSENVFLNAFWQVEKHFLASGNSFFIYFWSFLPVFLFFSSFILASGSAFSGQRKPFFSHFQVKRFPSSVNLFFNKSCILVSGN